LAVDDFSALQYIAKQTINTNVASDIEAIEEFLARNIEVFKQYWDAGADVNAMGGLFEWTLLHEAANVSKKIIVELLIAEGADVDARAFDVKTPVDVTIHPINSFNKVSKEITALLRKHGGKTSEELKTEGK